MDQTALLLLVLFPFAGAICAAGMKVPSVARTWALLVAFLAFAASVVVALKTLDGTTVTWGSDPNPVSIKDIGFAARLACDGVSLWLMLLTTGLVPLVILSVGPEIQRQPTARWYYVWILVLLGSLVGTFIAADALLFYFFFELTLVPTVLMIGVWGGPDRKRAAGKFFIYTFAGSVFTLIALIYLGSKAGSFEIKQIIHVAQNVLTANERCWIGLAMLVGFLVKTPVFPLHTWQPLAYAEAPNSATVLMAALMSKLGTYGLLRLTLPIAFVATPDSPANPHLVNLVIVLSLIGIVYGGLVAWVQKDMVKLIAYSSLSHLGLCVLAIFASSTLSLQGAMMYMVAHGLSTAALLMVIGMISVRAKSRDIEKISGLFSRMPVMGTLLVIFTMASIGLPITSGFVGEFISLQGVMNKLGLGVTIVASLGMILGAVYMLHMVAKVGFGPLKAPEGAQLFDATPREMLSLVPLVVVIFAVGIVPTPILNSFKTEVAAIAHWAPAVEKEVGPAMNEDALIQEMNRKP